MTAQRWGRPGGTWFLIGVTAPFLTQSMTPGSSRLPHASPVLVLASPDAEEYSVHEPRRQSMT